MTTDSLGEEFLASQPSSLSISLVYGWHPAGDRLMEDSRGKSRISRADFAVALIDEAENARYTPERFSVAY